MSTSVKRHRFSSGGFRKQVSLPEPHIEFIAKVVDSPIIIGLMISIPGCAFAVNEKGKQTIVTTGEAYVTPDSELGVYIGLVREFDII